MRHLGHPPVTQPNTSRAWISIRGNFVPWTSSTKPLLAENTSPSSTWSGRARWCKSSAGRMTGLPDPLPRHQAWSVLLRWTSEIYNPRGRSAPVRWPCCSRASSSHGAKSTMSAAPIMAATSPGARLAVPPPLASPAAPARSSALPLPALKLRGPGPLTRPAKHLCCSARVPLAPRHCGPHRATLAVANAAPYLTPQFLLR